MEGINLNKYKLRDYIDLLNHIVSTHWEKRLRPVSASFEITSYCNLKCYYCYNNIYNDKMRIENMKEHEILRVIDDLQSLGIIELIITGGEPFIRPDLLEIIKYIKLNTNIFITLQTNGTLLNEKDILVLSNLLSKYDTVQISLDGPKEIYESIKGKGLWDKVIKNIILLKDVGITVTINTVPTKSNINYLDTLAKIVPRVDGFGASPLAVFNKRDLHLIPDPKLAIDIEKKVERILEKRGIRYLGGIRGELCQYISTIKNISFDIKSEKIKNIHCDAGITKFHIAANGDVYPCVYLQFPKFLMGNVLREDIEKIWYNWDPSLLKRNLKNTVCEKCPYISLCKGGCTGMAYAFYNTIDRPDPRCIKNEHDYKI